MERINPKNLKHPRVFFTHFDNKIVTQRAPYLRKDIERRLKILLLTKSQIVCAASHLTSDFTYNFFRDNPILLREKLIIPALREDKIGISELFDKEESASLNKNNDKISFYNEHIDTSVSWKVTDNSPFFRENFLQELNNENSVLRMNLRDIPAIEISRMINYIEKDELLKRGKIDELIEPLRKKHQIILRNFRTLTYNVFGAKSVNCESALPQENYLDYSLADIAERKILLSDIHIFWKIFLELAFETFHNTLFSIENLDLLSFNDIHSVRQTIFKSNFQTTYDNIISQCIKAIQVEDQNKILYNIEELLSIREHLSKTFEQALSKELKPFFANKKRALTKTIGKNSTSICLGGLSFIPGLSTPATLTGILLESPSFFINIWQRFIRKSQFDDQQEYIKAKEKVLNKMIEQSDISQKTELLDMIQLVLSVISQKMVL